MDGAKSVEIKAAEESTADDQDVVSHGDTANSNSLDYTSDRPEAVQVLVPRVGGEYDPRPQEDGARRTIAYLLIGLLWLIVSGILILLSFGSIQVENIKDFGVVLSPIIALVSAATGFYYGTKSTSSTTR